MIGIVNEKSGNFYIEYEGMKTHSEKEMQVLMNNKTSRSIFNLIS